MPTERVFNKIKVKVAPLLNKVPCHEDILCLIEHHPMKMYGGVEVQRHTFLTLALVGSEW